ncbi:LOW QUALITY PROTEIN: hypothetical protein ElyMa_002679500 [Elysia marginata]|uniref:Apextrin C-terminal domain-containing protein n=1 Tax=Elysia marginata TaxID=1093978 RepID=A0AAV4HEB4_9GAST|nr:LOW QUALITY PROTEIN: hypothetical protein ElyMa_002679500 [Elysia marginata]
MAPQLHSLLPVMLCILTAGILVIQPASGNNMDPHVFPSHGPFFEGWYMRVIDSHRNASYGFLFALILPARGENLTMEMKSSLLFNVPKSHDNAPLLCASLLVNSPEDRKLGSPTGCFDPSDYSVLKDGKPVEHNPDDKTPPFEVKLANNISYIVTPTGTQFSVSIGDHRLEGETTSPVPWGPGGEGPESWLEHLPLPIHWFVYSFRSTVTTYSYTNEATGSVVKGGSVAGRPPVVAHLEKNWGDKFIEAWVWAEGVNTATDVYFSFSSGLIKELNFDIPAQLSGYRNPAKGFDCSFHPANSEHTLLHDGCAGTATLDVRSIECHVTIHLHAAPESFSSCLVTPQPDGFRLGCLESYTAVANVTATKILSGDKDHQIIPLSALEFGGLYMCNGKCPDV